MQCPTLLDLPAAPVGRSGWPWTLESPKAPPTRADASAWPKISVVTPSYNQGEFLEETIRSVLLQGYPNLEYIIIDGGSSDTTIEIIRKYEPWLKYWTSEKDNGQADAINKGLRVCSGEVFQWINSDDVLNLGALNRVGAAIAGHDCVAGAVVDFDAAGHRPPRPCRRLHPSDFITRPAGFLYHQPGVWLRTKLLRELGYLDTTLHYKFDWEVAIRYFDRWPRVAYIDDILAFFRLHPKSKTVSQGDSFVQEDLVVLELLSHRLANTKARAACRREVKKKHWRRRVDQLVTSRGLPRHRVLRQLCAEALHDPALRLDRYTLGAIRRLIIAM